MNAAENNITTPEIKAAYYTLGCKLNYSETATIARQLAERGIEEARQGEEPRICIVNTCSVTETADKKARTLIRRIARAHPEAAVIVTGCYAQLKPEEVASIEGVDVVLGSKEKARIAEYVEQWFAGPADFQIVESTAFRRDDVFSPSCARGERTRFFLKVQDGCDYFCSYCTIPYARGRSRSGLTEDIVAQARAAAAEGGREIVLTGVNIGDFGRNTGEDLLTLLRRLDAVEGIERYRISSIEPDLLSDDIIEFVAGESRAFMPSFHIPLQSGSDSVLKVMRRRYDTALFRHKIERIRSLMPDAFIGVDVIAGARGETPDEWRRSFEFIESLDVSRLHVFPYSERPGTAALHLADNVDKGERARRAAALVKLSDEKLKAFMLRMAGSRRPVLWEHPVKGGALLSGLTDNYLRVVAPVAPSALNEITAVRLEGIDPTRPETMTATPADHEG